MHLHDRCFNVDVMKTKKFHSASCQRIVHNDFVAIEGHLFYWLTKSMNHRNAALTRALAPLHCTVARWRVMNMLRQYPGVSIAEIADTTAVDRTTLTRTIDGLESDGFLRRTERADNRRIVELSLTRSGDVFYDRILPLVRRQNEQALEGIHGAETTATIALLEKLARNLRAAAVESVLPVST